MPADQKQPITESRHRQQLGDYADFLNQLLAERVVICRLMVDHARLAAAKATTISVAHSRFIADREHAGQHRLGIAERAVRIAAKTGLTTR